MCFFVTDGVADATTSNIPDPVAGASTVLDAFAHGDGERLIQTINPDLCAVLKAKGVKVAVIYTTFLPLPDNPFYANTSHIPDWIDQINPKLAACASPDYFFEVNPNQGVDEALKNLFLKAVAEARIAS